MVLEEIIGQIIIWALPVLVAVVFHEVAHGWVANRLGDPTAKKLGRLTLNPFAHVDLFGTILVPLMLILAHSPFVFGYAKPVPVNFHNLRNPKRDMIWVAAAGPAMNLLLAALFTIIWKLLAPMTGFQAQSTAVSGIADVFVPIVLMAQNGILINVTLAVFNMLPLPPLDGGRVLVGLLPRTLSLKVARVEPFGFVILIVLLMTRTLDHIIDPPTEFLLKLYLGIF
jgi:Zn-dependent protease